METCSAGNHSLQRQKNNYMLFYAISQFVITNRPCVLSATLGSLDGIGSLF